MGKIQFYFLSLLLLLSLFSLTNNNLLDTTVTSSSISSTTSNPDLIVNGTNTTITTGQNYNSIIVENHGNLTIINSYVTANAVQVINNSILSFNNIEFNPNGLFNISNSYVNGLVSYMSGSDTFNLFVANSNVTLNYSSNSSGFYGITNATITNSSTNLNNFQFTQFGYFKISNSTVNAIDTVSNNFDLIVNDNSDVNLTGEPGVQYGMIFNNINISKSTVFMNNIWSCNSFLVDNGTVTGLIQNGGSTNLNFINHSTVTLNGSSVTGYYFSIGNVTVSNSKFFFSGMKFIQYSQFTITNSFINGTFTNYYGFNLQVINSTVNFYGSFDLNNVSINNSVVNLKTTFLVSNINITNSDVFFTNLEFEPVGDFIVNYSNVTGTITYLYSYFNLIIKNSMVNLTGTFRVINLVVSNSTVNITGSLSVSNANFMNATFYSNNFGFYQSGNFTISNSMVNATIISYYDFNLTISNNSIVNFIGSSMPYIVTFTSNNSVVLLSGFYVDYIQLQNSNSTFSNVYVDYSLSTNNSTVYEYYPQSTGTGLTTFTLNSYFSNIAFITPPQSPNIPYLPLVGINIKNITGSNFYFQNFLINQTYNILNSTGVFNTTNFLSKTLNFTNDNVTFVSITTTLVNLTSSNSVLTYNTSEFLLLSTFNVSSQVINNSAYLEISVQYLGTYTNLPIYLKLYNNNTQTYEISSQLLNYNSSTYYILVPCSFNTNYTIYLSNSTSSSYFEVALFQTGASTIISPTTHNPPPPTPTSSSTSVTSSSSQTTSSSTSTTSAMDGLTVISMLLSTLLLFIVRMKKNKRTKK